MHIGKLIEQQSRPFVSLEFFPPKDPDTLPEFYEVVTQLQALKPLFASVTYGAGGGTQANTLEVTRELVHRGLPIMAHLTCVGADESKISQFLAELQKSGVETVLALRGDPPRDPNFNFKSQAFQHASDLVRFIKSHEPLMGIACALYPTPHPESLTYAKDREYSKEKMDLGVDFGITQLFFDVREYLALVHDLKKLGVTKPIIPGILTLQSFAALRRILSLSGANIPGKLYLQLEEADRKGGAKAVQEAGLKFAAEQIKRLLDSGAKGVHLYTLNRAEICLELMDRVGLKP
ncbi:MAG: methylenetetrahydrofolate reductase [Desulfovibrionaceae bacterium]|nr:methylenetetrahydrofolate reductase [Desulfovibrionaceae bacterium]